MWDPRKLLIVARFELRTALYSKQLALLLLFYGVGAGLASWVFLSAYHSAEETARATLAEQMGVPLSNIPLDLVREKALPWLFEAVALDEPTRQQLMGMDPLSIFFTFSALLSVVMLVLLGAGGITSELNSGGARFALFRCDRLSWAGGKVLGQLFILALGLLLSVFVAGCVGLWLRGASGGTQWLSLLRGAFCAWIYGAAHIGLLSAVAMVAKRGAKVTMLNLLLLLSLSVGHTLASADWLTGAFALSAKAVWLFPAHYKAGLWSGSVAVFLGAVLGLSAIALLAFGAGYSVFKRRDA